MIGSKSHDANLFHVLHELLQSDSSGAERRTGERHEYQCVQLLAPYDDQEMPDQSAFRHVLCQDLSLQGFSYITPMKPEHRALIVALGKVPFTFFVAQVVRVTPRDGEAGRDYIVGCRFLRRLN